MFSIRTLVVLPPEQVPLHRPQMREHGLPGAFGVARQQRVEDGLVLGAIGRRRSSEKERFFISNQGAWLRRMRIRLWISFRNSLREQAKMR